MSATSDEEDLHEKARVVAEATGRSEKDVLADLQDDGIVNLSNEEKPKDLVQQLTEAAELMNVVKKLNKDMSGNGVLNGKNNKTEVVVDTTLDGDLVDRAIESAQRKAENIKKLIITFAPVILLLTGGGMEAFGVINMFESEDEMNNDDDYDPGFDVYWGCTDWDADNYDENATDDDGTCYYDNGPDPPDSEQQLDIQNHHLSLVGDNELKVEFGLLVEGDFCCDDIELAWEIEVNGFYDDGLRRVTYHSYDEEGYIDLEQYWPDMGEGNYHARVEVKWMNEMWDEETTDGIAIEGEEDECTPNIQSNGGELVRQLPNDPEDLLFDIKLELYDDNACDPSEVDTIFDIYLDGEHMEGPVGQTETILGDINNPTNSVFEIDPSDYQGREPYGVWTVECRWIPSGQSEQWCDDTLGPLTIEEPEPPEPCDAEIINHYRGHVEGDAEQDAVLIAFRVVPSEGCSNGVEVDIELYQTGYAANYTSFGHTTSEIEGTDFSHTFDGVAVGTWIPKVTAYDISNDQIVESIEMWSIDIEEPEVETCEINLYDIALSTNNTSAAVGYDLDCGEDFNDLDGYNVTIQFLVYEVGETNSGPNATGPVNWTVDEHYIQGWVEDVNVLTLNFSASNSTHFDFYWYALWTDGDGEPQMIEIKWLNREVNP